MDFLNGSFRIGRLFGIDVRIHILFVVWIGYQLITAGQYWVEEAQFWGLLFGIVLIHELGHCFGARSVGGDAHNILMWPLGGLAYAQAPMRPWPQFVTVACGPLVNVAFCVISAVLLLAVAGDAVSFSLNPLAGGVHITRPVAHWLYYVALFYHVNYFLLAFNLLPIYPLDGGQLFQASIWPQVGLQRATRIACYVGITGCVLLGVWAMRGGGGGILFFIAIFGGFTCYQRLKMAQYGMIIEDDRFVRSNYSSRREGFWSRLFKRRGGERPRAPIEHPTSRPSPNPNPGGWEAKRGERERLEADLDRILKKVSEHGIQSLSYVERQMLEQATRQRQHEERKFQKNSKL